jgi:predicted transcriptional regulator
MNHIANVAAVSAYLEMRKGELQKEDQSLRPGGGAAASAAARLSRTK